MEKQVKACYTENKTFLQRMSLLWKNTNMATVDIIPHADSKINVPKERGGRGQVRGEHNQHVG